ncbi:MAG TPA: hypothetical protein VN420_01215, partial [Candidatus Fimivivens sp.]|nr:hypothetical protein [Candidatus Fimivivens sp.]
LWLQEKNYAKLPDGPEKVRLGKTIQKTKEAIRVQDEKHFTLALLKRERDFQESKLLRSESKARPDDEGLQAKMCEATERFKLNGEKVDRIAVVMGLDEDGKDRLATDILERIENETRRVVAESKKKKKPKDLSNDPVKPVPDAIVSESVAPVAEDVTAAPESETDADYNRRFSKSLHREIDALEKYLGKLVKKEVGRGKSEDTTVLDNLESNLWLQEKNYAKLPDGPEKVRLGKTIQKTKEAIRVQDEKHFTLAVLKIRRDSLERDRLKGESAARPDDEDLRAKVKEVEGRIGQDTQRVAKIGTNLGLDGDGKDRLATDVLDRLKREVERTVSESKPKPKDVKARVLPDDLAEPAPAAIVSEPVSKRRTRGELDGEIRRLLMLSAEGQGTEEEFGARLDQEIADLHAGLVRERKQLDDWKWKAKHTNDVLAPGYVEVLEKSISDTESDIRRKKTDLELRKNPELLRQRLDTLQKEKDERFPVKEKKQQGLGELPPLENRIDELKRRADELRNESGMHDIYLQGLRNEQAEVTKVYAESLSKWAEQRNRIGDIKKILTGLKSGTEIEAKLEEERPVTADDLKEIQGKIREIEAKRSATEASLEAIFAEIESLAKEPGAGQNESDHNSELAAGSPETEVPETKTDSILDYESFTTSKGSTYQVLPDGRVQRTKHNLDDPNYIGEDKGTGKVREPSDMMLFCRPGSPESAWLSDFGATDHKTDERISSVIDLGVYVEGEGGTYQLIRNNLGMAGKEFLLVRVRKDDTFKLKESFSFDELRAFQERTLLPENKGIGAIFLSQSGDITNIPTEGFNTVDYRYNEDGSLNSMHNGHQVVSIVKKQIDASGQVPDADPVSVKTGEPEIAPKEAVAPAVANISLAAQMRLESIGIAPADLYSVKGFTDLTLSQQSFVAEMLRQTAARKIEDQARDAVANKGGMLKNFNLAKSRKAAAGEVLHGGMKTYGEDLKQLVDGVKASGLDMEEKNGKFDIRFLSMPEGFEQDGTLKAEGESFNEAANRFASIPYEWSLKSASKSERKSYGEAKQAFEVSRDELERAMFSPDRGETTKEYANLTKEYGAIRVAENRVRLIQQLTAHPEVGEYLDTLKHQNTFLAGLKSVASERVGYFVGGAAGRAAGMAAATTLGVAGTVGLAVAPLVSMVSGGFMGYRRAQETLIEQDRQARRGKDAVTKAVSGEGAGWFKKLIAFPNRKSEARLVAGKRRMVRASVSPEEMAGDRRKRGLAERLDDISEQVRAADPESTQSKRALAALQSRVEYVKERLETDAVNFGDGAEGVRARISLMEALARAEMNLGLFQDSEHRRAIEEAFGIHLRREENDVQDKRKEYRRKEALNGAVMAGTISLLGAGAMSAAQEATAAFHHVPGSGSAKAHLDAIYGKEGIIEDDPMQVRGVVKQAAGSHVPGPGALPETAGQAPTGAGTARVATETLHQAAEERGAKAVETAGRTYAETAKPGEGVTHLARRAFAEYAKEKNIGLSPEQKVYVEDYLQKQVAHVGKIGTGDRVEFTPDLMNEAVAKAKGLSPDQIRNLHQYAEGVRGSGSGIQPDDVPSPSGARTAADAAVDPAPKSVGPEESDAAPAPKTPVRELADAATPELTDPKATDAAREAVDKDITDQVKRLESVRDSIDGKSSVVPDDLPPIWGRRADERFFRQYAGLPAGSLFRDSLNAVVDPEASSMDPARAEYIGRLFLEARRNGFVPRPRESTFGFFLRVGERHPGKGNVFIRFASGARKYGGRGIALSVHN